MKGTLTGLRAWLVQRATALYMMAYIVFMGAYLASDGPHSYESWRLWIMRADVGIATFTFFTALLLHAWIGIRDVVLDYVKPMTVRVPVLGIAGFGLLAMAAWVARILLAM